jgi:hypothetical protein
MEEILDHCGTDLANGIRSAAKRRNTDWTWSVPAAFDGRGE